MDNVVEEEQVGNYTVKVYYDDDCGNQPFDYDMPDTWGIDMSNHRDYSSPTYGDEMPVSMEVAMDPEPEDKWDRARFQNDYYVLPIFMYDHSGRTVNCSGFSCQWDSGCTGFVYISKKAFIAEGMYGVKKSWTAAKRQEVAEKFLKNTVKGLDCHMTGQVYGYVVEDMYSEVESCWGFVGDIEYCMGEGKAVARACIRNDRKRRLARVKELIVNRVPLQVREQELGGV